MEIAIVAAFCKKFGLGSNNSIPWDIKEDMKHFADLTKGHIIIMGRKTYETIPVTKRPLKDRFNIVLTSEPFKYGSDNNLVFTNFNNVSKLLTSLEHKYSKAFIIGGSQIYADFLPKATHLYITKIDKLYACDSFFPEFTDFKLVEYSDTKYSVTEECNYRFLKYESTQKTHQEYVYIDLLKDILKKGITRTDRTGTGTIGVFGRQIRFDVSETIPLLTTKFVSWKAIVEELLWFLRGDTDSKILENKNINIWKPNTTREFLDGRGLTYQEGDIGPMYGFNLRHCGAEYEGCGTNYENQGIDQLQNVINQLKTDPFSRRIMMTTYDPKVLDKGVLHPCHGISIQLYVSESENVKYLSGSMYQRSADTFLGFSNNITSYSVLLYILAKLTDMIPKELIISIGDTHIYNNHIDQVKTQMKRKPFPFPKLVVKDIIKNKKIEEWTIDDFDLIGYLYHPLIHASMSV